MLEDGVVAGNLFDKYGSRSPIVRFLMKNFIVSFKALVSGTGAGEVHEIGCGEGHLSIILAGQKKKIFLNHHASDQRQRLSPCRTWLSFDY